MARHSSVAKTRQISWFSKSRCTEARFFRMRFAPANASSRDKGLRAFLIAIPCERANELILSPSCKRRLCACCGSVRFWIYTTTPVPERSLLLASYLARCGTKGGSSTRAALRTIKFECVVAVPCARNFRKRGQPGDERMLAPIHKPIWNATDHTYYMTHGAGCTGA